MLSFLFQMLVLLQPEATAPATNGAAGGAGAPPGCASDPSLYLLPLLLVFMYVVLIRPQRKQQQQHEAVVKSLKKGDVVRTDGGIRGEILALTDRDVTLQIDHKTKINILRTRIAGSDAPEGAADKAVDKAEKAKDAADKPKES